ncbi:hypothetical protein GCM10012285_36760 [Streptomyces kronopolitis]|uniref:Uncharacterized protein n=1 Tax=Streptomyces kronopolitis TaxID=1612435 RepID=A0ABQ2JNQ3_9ACTN|nr:hypothetical protein GCM10012285_36760 [Streptomyces kronopolitis]
MTKGPEHREGRAQITRERRAPGHGHVRSSASPSPRGPERRATGRPAGPHQGGGQGVHAQFLRRNKEDLTED